MNPDDEIFLSAYLDGELNPREQLRVESLLRSDPRLAARLHHLASVRELVAGLSRPLPPHDVSTMVVARLREQQERRFWKRPFGGRPASVIAGVSAAAALILMVVGFALRSSEDHAVRGPLAARHIATNRPQASLPTPVEVSTVRPASPNALSQPRHSDRSTEDLALATQSEDQFRRILDNPNLKRIFIVTDQIGGRASEKVNKLVEYMPRIDSTFARVTIAEGIIIDPKHPGEAQVFAVAVNDQELRQLRGDLQNAFPDGSVEEEQPEPALVTQLADIGQVSILPGTSVPRLVSSSRVQERNALKADRPVIAPDPPAEDDVDEPGIERYRSAPANVAELHQPPGSPRPGRVADEKRKQTPDFSRNSVRVASIDRMRRNRANIVLIWVASR